MKRVANINYVLVTNNTSQILSWPEITLDIFLLAMKYELRVRCNEWGDI
jgi:hypothetical protein